jgi:iron complex transport system ATP-binding protein
MALAQDTDYILLDEPTTYLDISHQIELMKLLRKLADNGKGIIAVMHDLPMAFNYSDEILVIENGKSRVQSNPIDICGSAVIKEVFNVQIERLVDGRYCYAGI